MMHQSATTSYLTDPCVHALSECPLPHLHDYIPPGHQTGIPLVARLLELGGLFKSVAHGAAAVSDECSVSVVGGFRIEERCTAHVVLSCGCRVPRCAGRHWLLQCC